MNDTDKRAKDHYEKYFKPTGEVRVPKYGELYLNLDSASYVKVKQVPKEPYAGMFEPKNPYVIMEEVEDVLEPPLRGADIVFFTKDSNAYMGCCLDNKYYWEPTKDEIHDVIAWKYTSAIFEEMTNGK